MKLNVKQLLSRFRKPGREPKPDAPVKARLRSFSFSRTFLLKATLVVLCGVAAHFMVALWVLGDGETKDAFDSGRRLLIAIDTGEVSGKLVGGEEKAAEPAILADPAKPEDQPADTGEIKIDPNAPQENSAETPPSEIPTSGDESGQTITVTTVIAEPPPAPDLSKLPPVTPSANPLPDMLSDISETTSMGMLPVIGKNGTMPWRYYAKPFERKGNQPIIAIVVTGLGHNKTVTDAALKLPENVTLSFSPYAKDVGSWSKAAHVTGHETLFDLPLEPSNYPATDPGPYGLLIGKGADENERRLQWVMSRASSYVGLLTPQNELYSGNIELFKVLLQSVANRGLLMVMGKEPPKTETKTVIETSNTAIVIADALIDEELSAITIQARFAILEQIAKKQGYAIGVAQAFPITLEQLHQWSATLAEKGIMLAPVSAVAKLRFS